MIVSEEKYFKNLWKGMNMEYYLNYLPNVVGSQVLSVLLSRRLKMCVNAQLIKWSLSASFVNTQICGISWAGCVSGKLRDFSVTEGRGWSWGCEKAELGFGGCSVGAHLWCGTERPSPGDLGLGLSKWRFNKELKTQIWLIRAALSCSCAWLWKAHPGTPKSIF